MIKKLLLFCVFIFGLSMTSYAQAPISVYLNGEVMKFDQNPIMDNGHTLVPLRSIFEALGADVKWDSALQQVTGKRDDTEIKLIVGQATATVDGETVKLDASAKLINGSTFVPLRFIAESLCAIVSYDEKKNEIDINSADGLKNSMYIETLDSSVLSGNQNKDSLTESYLNSLEFVLFNRNLDINGDGKKDKIQVSFRGHAYNEAYKKIHNLSYPMETSIIVDVNGKTISVANFTTINGYDSYFGSPNGVSIEDIDKTDSQKEIVVSDSAQGSYYTNVFFSWDGQKVNNIGGLAGLYSDYKIPGDGTINGFVTSKLIPKLSYQGIYKLVGKTQLVKVPQAYYDLYQRLDIATFKVKTDSKMRKAPALNSAVAADLRPGEIVKGIVVTNDNEWAGLRTENNIDGWINIADQDSYEFISDKYEYLAISDNLRSEVFNFNLLTGLSLRKDAKSDSAIVATLKPDEKVNVILSDEDGWIKLKSGSGVEGWCELTQDDHIYVVKENNLDLEEVFETLPLVNE